MKYVLLITALLGLSACGVKPPESKAYQLPEKLKHCEVFKIDGDGPILHVTYCPNATTSTRYTESKSSYEAVVVGGSDGNEAKK